MFARAVQSQANSQLQRPRPTQPLKPAKPSMLNAGIVGKLHENVQFDDFPDDDDLDLDENSSPVPSFKSSISGFAHVAKPTPLPSVPSQLSNTGSHPIKRSTPSLPQKPSTNGSFKQLQSSAPIPWSSSPHNHQNQPNPPPINSTPDSQPIVKPAKRRVLPSWDKPDEQKKLNPYFIHTDQKRDGKRRKIATVETRPDEPERFTPHAKSKEEDSISFPWNVTASAIKAEQKALRESNRDQPKNTTVLPDRTANPQRMSTKDKVFMPIELSEEQAKVVKLVVDGKKSVFFTGSAGTGKSVLLRDIIRNLRLKYKKEQDRIAVTASTGLAACNVGGSTLHSFAGIGLGKDEVPELVRKIKRNAKAKVRWQRTKVLVVDEISMVDGDLFDKLENIARIIRSNGRPFGGIQLVITGDFFQLPPVPDNGRIAKFAFDAATWNTSIEHTIGLNKVFRQKDPTFANMLNEMRVGKLTPQSIDTFKSLCRPLHVDDSFQATELFPTRNEVDTANNTRMRNLGGSSWDFRAEDGGQIADKVQRDKLLSNCMAPPLITLKKGAQVMLIKNIDDQLVNGSVGKVVAFMDERTFDHYHEDEDGFQALEANPDQQLDNGTLSKSKQRIREMINKDIVGGTSQKWPLVRFPQADGTSRDLLCQREMWKIELPNGEVQASRSQIPLILAWALSIHKAQGQTLDKVKVDLGKIFEKGQAYVALSRATCQEGLQILRFDPKKVMAHQKVRSFYDSLYGIDELSKGGRAEVKTTKGREAQTARQYEDLRAEEEAEWEFMRAMG